jgi:S1-C subfamily serine protease
VATDAAGAGAGLVDGCPQHAADLASLVGPGHCSVPRAVFFPPKGCLTTEPRLVPGADGLHVMGIKADSIYGKCGFREGDVWLKINDITLSSPEEMLKAYPALREAPGLTFSLLRGGQPVTVRLDLK